MNEDDTDDVGAGERADEHGADGGGAEGDEYDFWRSYMEMRQQKKDIRRFPRMVKRALGVVWQSGRGPFLGNIALTVVTGAGTAVQLLAMQRALTAVLDADRAGAGAAEVVGPIAVLAGITVVLQVARAIQMEQTQLLGKRVERSLTDGVLDAAASVDLAAFESHEFHNRVQRASDGAGFRTTSLVFGLMNLSGSLFAVLGIAAYLAVQAPLLLALVAIGGVPVALVRRKLGQQSFDFFVAETESDRQRDYLRQVLTGRDEAKEVRAFNLGPPLRARFDHLYGEHLGRYLAYMRRRVTLNLLGSVFTAAAAAVAIGALVWMLLTDRIGVAAAAAVAAAVQQLTTRIQGLLTGSTSLYESALFLEDHHQFLDIAAEARRERPTGTVAGPFTRLAAEGVRFTYPNAETPALVDVDVEVRAGEVIALVGENGSGKTTLAKILCGLYRPTGGAVMWDGTDLAGVDPDSSGAHIAVLFQDFARYELTARENIGLGRHERIDDDVALHAAAASGGAADVVRRLPTGYDTVLSKRFKGGRDLSVGQWQRVAMSRAFFRDADFLVLDEPTAALDPRAEHALFEQVRALAAGRSVLLISHRFSSVRSADRIYVLDQGRVVERGNHEELMAAGGLYRELFLLQAAAYNDPAAAPAAD